MKEKIQPLFGFMATNRKRTFTAFYRDLAKNEGVWISTMKLLLDLKIDSS